jgi:anti-sigma regulatory factor (Ser/Thr protein kinase)
MREPRGHGLAVRTSRCTMPERRVVLPNDPTSARAARQFLQDASCVDHMATVLDDAQLLVSELVGNAIRHGLPPIEVAVCCVGEAFLEVRVRDTEVATPLAVQPADLEDEGGRGLQLVDLLSNAWGTEVDHSCKTVWFRLEII